jgi:hypothetical protein
MKLFPEMDFCLLIPCYNNFNGLIVSLKSVIYSSENYLVLFIGDGSKEAISFGKGSTRKWRRVSGYVRNK